jgi:hypothetical protein
VFLASRSASRSPPPRKEDAPQCVGRRRQRRTFYCKRDSVPGCNFTSFSPETVQEFTVLTSAFSAGYGQSGGNRKPVFATAPFTLAATNRPVVTLKYNQFSASADGPVRIPKIYTGKDKTFFFGAMEPQYRRYPPDQYRMLPTDGMRNGDFSGLVSTASGWFPAGRGRSVPLHRSHRRRLHRR